MTNAPVARSEHVAVWTGSRMVVWGGTDGDLALGDGATLRPGRGLWTAVSPAAAPVSARSATAVWTGSRMIVWGGYGTAPIATGGRYDPVADSWSIARPPVRPPRARGTRPSGPATG